MTFIDYSCSSRWGPFGGYVVSVRFISPPLLSFDAVGVILARLVNHLRTDFNNQKWTFNYGVS